MIFANKHCKMCLPFLCEKEFQGFSFLSATVELSVAENSYHCPSVFKLSVYSY